MTEETTSISDLPTTTSNNTPVQESNIQMHITEPNQVQNIVSGIQKAAAAGTTNLPSRDIPTNTSQVNSDEQVIPNYVPTPNNTDYIQNFNTQQQILNKQIIANNKKENLEYIVEELQLPILVSLLYCLFQMPYIKSIMTSYLPFLFNTDGNYNLYGYFGNSLLFGLLYYLMMHIIRYIG